MHRNRVPRPPESLLASAPRPDRPHPTTPPRGQSSHHPDRVNPGGASVSSTYLPVSDPGPEGGQYCGGEPHGVLPPTWDPVDVWCVCESVVAVISPLIGRRRDDEQEQKCCECWGRSWIGGGRSRVRRSTVSDQSFGRHARRRARCTLSNHAA